MFISAYYYYNFSLQKIILLCLYQETLQMNIKKRRVHLLLK